METSYLHHSHNSANEDDETENDGENDSQTALVKACNTSHQDMGKSYHLPTPPSSMMMMMVNVMKKKQGISCSNNISHESLGSQEKMQKISSNFLLHETWFHS